ncbi:hypothetical protein [Actibacterium ureilyticum]|uniref:hypothetical protein n=1 Tax=Actibacterium ureilyticum TaxID=1590614 RepID=UPI000BAB1158|nr:hypothetical protein [Actibacterium ureilyticum]
MARAFLLIILLLFPLRLAAQSDAQFDRLYQALHMADLLDIMREEGMSYGDEIQGEMFPERGGDRWAAMVARIYSTERMDEIMQDGMRAALADVDLAPLVAYYSDGPGARVTDLEVSARRALLEPGAEEASLEKLQELRDDADPRLDLVGQFIDANDLVDLNLSGALNSNYEFYIGLTDGGAFPFEMTEDQILADVWSQEAEIEAETQDWLYSYLALAYKPLSDAELTDYIDMSETPEGQALNRALFSAFDVLYRRISRELGLAAAKMIVGEDI